MIRIITTEGTFEIPANVQDVETSPTGLKVLRQGTVIAQFRKWQHWHEITDTTDKD